MAQPTPANPINANNCKIMFDQIVNAPKDSITPSVPLLRALVLCNESKFLKEEQVLQATAAIMGNK
jgi:hypothetical protein